MSREAMQMALEALESDPISHTGLVSRKQAIAILRQALVDADDTSQERVDEKAKREQEPVAWMHNFIEGNVITHIPADIGRHPERWTALYKNPTPCKTCESLAMAVMNDQTYHEKVIPKREWVGLTDEEIQDLIYVSQKIDASNSPWFDCLGFYRAIEAKLKEKNV